MPTHDKNGSSEEEVNYWLTAHLQEGSAARYILGLIDLSVQEEHARAVELLLAVSLVYDEDEKAPCWCAGQFKLAGVRHDEDCLRVRAYCEEKP